MRKAKPINREHAFALILAVLYEGSRHGYDIAREVDRRTGNRLRFNEGTLYPVLHALESEGCIVSAWDTSGGERPKRIYTITEKGINEFKTHVAAWKEFTGAINEVLKEHLFAGMK